MQGPEGEEIEHPREDSIFTTPNIILATVIVLSIGIALTVGIRVFKKWKTSMSWEMHVCLIFPKGDKTTNFADIDSHKSEF